MIDREQLVEPNCPECGRSMSYKGETPYTVLFMCFSDGTELCLPIESMPPETEAEVDAYLRRNGYDPDVLAADARRLFLPPAVGADSRMQQAMEE